jgi:toxin HigB-1
MKRLLGVYSKAFHLRSFPSRLQGLKKLYADDVVKGVPSDAVDKLGKMLAFLNDREDPEELRTLPPWKVHALSGDRKGTWSLSVTASGRLTLLTVGTVTYRG